jgi:hypothetical protein
MAGTTDYRGIPMELAPNYLVRDNDGVYGQAFAGRVRAMDLRVWPISPRSALQNAYAERRIGTLRRDYLDHVIVFGARHLRQILESYAPYCTQMRTHLSLRKNALRCRAVQRYGYIVSTSILSGLHHQYARI